MENFFELMFVVKGYHWRVMVEDKAGASGSDKTFSWWDIQDGNAKLPVKETSQYELRKLLFPSKPPSSTTDTATKAAKGAFKMMGKAVAAAVGEDAGVDHGPPVSVLAFKLLDLVKIHDDFNLKHGGHAAPPAPRAAPQPRATPAPRPPAQPRAAPQQQQQQHAAPRHQPAPRTQPVPQHRAPTPARPPPQQHQQQQRAPQQEASLMDFSESPASSHNKGLHHTTSSPASFGANPNETRTEILKREYEKKNQTANRVWDDIDERWVEVDPKAGAATRSTVSAPPGTQHSSMPTKTNKVVGIKLDASSAAGKSAGVQAAVNKRVNDMQESQQKALHDLRTAESKKKKDEEEEDVVRKQLEPKIKVWSEEHGKKKQLRALLASLHTILWSGATWKQISIGDVLDAGKVKRFFHKATLVVHPDKTHHLPPTERFLAKRIFDALSQAKTEFDDEPR
jgi:hypothetical protein